MITGAETGPDLPKGARMQWVSWMFWTSARAKRHRTNWHSAWASNIGAELFRGCASSRHGQKLLTIPIRNVGGEIRPCVEQRIGGNRTLSRLYVMITVFSSAYTTSPSCIGSLPQGMVVRAKTEGASYASFRRTPQFNVGGELNTVSSTVSCVRGRTSL